MSPQEHDTRPRSPRSTAISVQWDRYLATGGQRAHGDLLQEVDRYVRSEAGRMLGHRHPLFEEVAQEALVGAARRIGTRERPDHPAAYLRKIVSNKVADLLQREHRRRLGEEQQWTPDLEPLEASMSVDWQDFLDTLRTIVSADEYWTLLLKYHFDYSYGEIGQLLDKEPNAVRQIAHRGRRKCKEHISRLQGRVPGWVALLEREPPEASAPSEAGDGSGTREPRTADPTDRQRRPSVGSDSGPGPGTSSPAEPPPDRGAGRARRPLGTPATVLPLVLAVVLPALVRLDGSLAAPPPVPIPLTADPAGPQTSVDGPTVPTASREAPSTTAADMPVELDPVPESGSSSTGPLVTGSTTSSTTLPSSSAPETTTPSTTVPDTSATTAPPSTTVPSTTVPSTTVLSTTVASTTVPSTAPTTTPTTRSTTTRSTTTRSTTTRSTTTRPTTVTSAASSAPTTTVSTTASTTTTTTTTTTTAPTTTTTTTAPPRTTTTSDGSTTTTSGRGSGDGDPPGDT